jgi:flagellar basal-body rod modification protein FlgD
MSSIWSSAAAQAGTSPLSSTRTAPTPGGGAAAKFQSILQAAGKQGQAAGQPGLSPKAGSAAGAASPMAAASGSGSTSDSDATISANDFLTLLVTEMQNQDPTADVDPNEYIDQLVQINSLEQLISINQNLTTVLDAASSTPTSGVKSASGTQTQGGKGSSSAVAAVQSARASSQPAIVRGNLSAPGTAPAARTVAHALDGHARAAPHGHAIRDIPTRALP